MKQARIRMIGGAPTFNRPTDEPIDGARLPKELRAANSLKRTDEAASLAGTELKRGRC
jgi:hypothetical protein